MLDPLIKIAFEKFTKITDPGLLTVIIDKVLNRIIPETANSLVLFIKMAAEKFNLIVDPTSIASISNNVIAKLGLNVEVDDMLKPFIKIAAEKFNLTADQVSLANIINGIIEKLCNVYPQEVASLAQFKKMAVEMFEKLNDPVAISIVINSIFKELEKKHETKILLNPFIQVAAAKIENLSFQARIIEPMLDYINDETITLFAPFIAPAANMFKRVLQSNLLF